MAVLVGWTARLTADGARAEIVRQPLTDLVGMVSDPVDDALAGGELPGTGPDARYLVTWGDPNDLGAPGWASSTSWSAGATTSVSPSSTTGAPHRARPRPRPTPRSTCRSAPTWTAGRAGPASSGSPTPTVAPTPSGRTTSGWRRVIEDLEAASRDDLVPWVDSNPFGLSFETRGDGAIHDRVVAMLDLGLPMAVYVGPPAEG